MNRRERTEKQWTQKLGYRVWLALFPGLPCFWLPLVCTIIHRSGKPLLCIIVNTNGRSKQGRLGNEAIECENGGTVLLVPRLFWRYNVKTHAVCSVDCYSFPISDKYSTRNICSSCRFSSYLQGIQEKYKTFTKYIPHSIIILCPKTGQFILTVADTVIIWGAGVASHWKTL